MQKLFTPLPNRFEIRPPFSHDEEMQGLKKQERKRGNDEKYRVNYQQSGPPPLVASEILFEVEKICTQVHQKNKSHTPTALFFPNSNIQKYA